MAGRIQTGHLPADVAGRNRSGEGGPRHAAPSIRMRNAFARQHRTELGVVAEHQLRFGNRRRIAAVRMFVSRQHHRFAKIKLDKRVLPLATGGEFTPKVLDQKSISFGQISLRDELGLGGRFVIRM